MVLWKRESASDNACYIDLLPSNRVYSAEFETLKTFYRNLQKNDEISCEIRKQGNELFQAENWTEAMQKYNKSICIATNGSENIALGYANRSTCFLRLEMYDECLADIELAKKANYPEHLMQKLNDRKVKCLKAMEESTKINKNVTWELSSSSSTKFPGMADILEVRSNDEHGKHVAATRDIEVGKIVLLEDAFAFRSDFGYETVCKTCGKHKMNFIPCRNCIDVMFCCAECMESNDFHKEFCGTLYNRQHRHTIDVELILIAVSAFPNAESLIKFVEDTLASRDLDSPECESDSQAKYRLFLKLYALPREINGMRNDIFNTYKLLLDIPLIEQFFYSKQEKRFLMHLIWQHLCISATHCFGIASTDGSVFMNMIGICSSLFNHSCAPNILHLIFGNKMIGIIQRPVKKGEQLFINYFQGSANVASGQQTLGFQCKCSKCVPRWKRGDRTRMQSDDNYLFLRKNMKRKDLEDHEKRSILMPKFQNWLTKFGRLPWSPEYQLMGDGYKKCFMEELSNWNY